MKSLLVLAIGLLVVPGYACGQGWFTFANRGAPTRIGSADGPLAGPGIWAQALVGTTSDSLTPLGLSVQHRVTGTGLISAYPMPVPGTAYWDTVYVQLVAWSGALWGTNFAAVPAAALGRTDVVPVVVLPNNYPLYEPRFTQPSIVPIPEPGAVAVVGLGLVLLALGRRWSGERCAT